MKKMQLIAFAAAAAAFAFTSVANAGISLTRHNMSTSGGWNYTIAGGGATDNTVTNGDTAEICVFCHTPHGGNTSGPGPLWNREFNNVVSDYSQYNSWTIDGTNPGDGQRTGSMLCLSCHDGTQAMDALINAPTTTGSANYSGVANSASDQGWEWVESKFMSSGVIATELAWIGTDLTNDHPIMIQYGGGGVSNGAVTADLVDSHFNMPDSATKGGTEYWYFDTDTSGGLSGADIKMYTYNLGGVDQPFVECYTCHDPHVETNRPFLRMSNSGSDLCLTCHDK